MHLTAQQAFARRDTAGLALSDDSHRIAVAGRDMAARFRRGGKLILFGEGVAATDAAHVAVEFMDPVIVGRRALPAIALKNDSTTGGPELFAHQLHHWADPVDVAMAISPTATCPRVLRGLAEAAELRLLTIALTGEDGQSTPADHVIVARSADPAVIKEIHVTVYHILWDLVHIYLDQQGAGDGRA
jgi:D-sedoheptulose 7-phosphate isomerase